jgi:hypothetical protein
MHCYRGLRWPPGCAAAIIHLPYRRAAIAPQPCGRSRESGPGEIAGEPGGLLPFYEEGKRTSGLAEPHGFKGYHFKTRANSRFPSLGNAMDGIDMCFRGRSKPRGLFASGRPSAEVWASGGLPENTQ